MSDIFFAPWTTTFRKCKAFSGVAKRFPKSITGVRAKNCAKTRRKLAKASARRVVNSLIDTQPLTGPTGIPFKMNPGLIDPSCFEPPVVMRSYRQLRLAEDFFAQHPIP